MIVRAYAPGATGGTLNVYVQDTASGVGGSSLIDLSKINAKWTDVSIHVDSITGFDASSVKQVNVEVASGTGAGPWTNPTIVYIDGIRASNLTVSDTFDSSVGNFVKSSLFAVPGSAISWSQSVP